jgi:hypothetical protein
MNLRTLASALIVTELIGCGSGSLNDVEETVPSAPPDSTGSSTTVHFEGIWQGTSAAIALVNGWGEFRLLAEDVQFVGFPKRTQSAIEGVVTGIRSAGTTWNDGSHVSQFTLIGSITEDHSIDARYEGPQSGTLSMSWAAAEANTAIATIDGIWALRDENRNVVATIQIDAYSGLAAEVFGSHANGCTYSGESESWTSAYSYDFSPLELSGCPLIDGVDLNGTYVGTGALIDLADDGSDELVFVVALSNDANQISFLLDKVSE